MKIIETMIAMVLGIALAFAFWTGFDVFERTYHEAVDYNNMSKTELSILYVMDNNTYDRLKESYEFISGLPLIGDTL